MPAPCNLETAGRGQRICAPGLEIGEPREPTKSQPNASMARPHRRLPFLGRVARPIKFAQTLASADDETKAQRCRRCLSASGRRVLRSKPRCLTHICGAIVAEACVRGTSSAGAIPNYATRVGTHLPAGRQGTVGGTGTVGGRARKGPLCRSCESGPENARSVCGPSSLAGSCRQSDDLAKVIPFSPPLGAERERRHSDGLNSQCRT